jgi:hypothetical protein
MLAPPWIPIPPPGHDVDLFCTPESHSRARVHPPVAREASSRAHRAVPVRGRSRCAGVCGSTRKPSTGAPSTSSRTTAVTRRWPWPTACRPRSCTPSTVRSITTPPRTRRAMVARVTSCASAARRAARRPRRLRSGRSSTTRSTSTPGRSGITSRGLPAVHGPNGRREGTAPGDHGGQGSGRPLVLAGLVQHEMARMVDRASEIDPMRCRQTAAERFAPDRVAAAYETVCREAVYRQTVAVLGRNLAPCPARGRPGRMTR